MACRRTHNMTTPTPKRLVVQSLRSLHKQRMTKQFRIQALPVLGKMEERPALRRQVQALEAKIQWESRTHAALLGSN